MTPINGRLYVEHLQWWSSRTSEVHLGHACVYLQRGTGFKKPANGRKVLYRVPEATVRSVTACVKGSEKSRVDARTGVPGYRCIQVGQLEPCDCDSHNRWFCLN